MRKFVVRRLGPGCWISGWENCSGGHACTCREHPTFQQAIARAIIETSSRPVVEVRP